MIDRFVEIYNRLQQIHVLLDDGDRHALNDVELSSPQYHLLLHLYTKGGERGLMITEIANLLICSRSNATRLVQRLEQQELVQLNRNEEDRRLVLVTLTELGVERYVRASALHRAAVHRRFESLPVELLEQLEEGSRVFVQTLEEDLQSLE